MFDIPREELERDKAVYKAAELALKGAIVEKSKLYFGYGLLALIAYPFAAFGPDWVRWIAGFLIAILLVGELSMFGVLRRLQQFYAPFRADFVLRNHALMAAVAVLALIYSLLGLWGRWPVPWLALLVAAVINLLHGLGYAPRKVDG